MDRCTNCQYYDRQNKSQSVGQCRRHAPALSPINVKAYMIEGVWPTVREDDWCGEWRATARRADARGHDLLAVNAPLQPQAQPMRVSSLPIVQGGALATAIGGQRGND